MGIVLHGSLPDFKMDVRTGRVAAAAYLTNRLAFGHIVSYSHVKIVGAAG